MKIPRPEAGPRASLPEILWIVRMLARDPERRPALMTMLGIRTEVAARRARRHLDDGEIKFLTMAQTAFVLCRSKHFVRGLLRDGTLSGTFTPREISSTGYGFWRIPAAEVRELAEERETASVCDLC